MSLLGHDRAETLATDIDPEADYYQSIQEYFVSRRGDPLFLSNAEWLLIRKWRRAGVPLRIVLRGVRDAMDAHDLSWSRGNRVRSLRYCAAGVEQARRHWHRALSFEPHERARVSDFLALRAQALIAAQGLGPRAARLRDRIVATIERRVARPGETAELDVWLQKQEAELVKALCDDMTAAECALVRQDVELRLAPYRDRMPEKVIEQVRNESLARTMLDRHLLPRLSLFHGE
ncbi:MAG: hypothetical protein JXO72_08325 [Vicinamibacteria bacterium]|nr:hypothetical protein [Vicinamibacteria bacterium]